MLPSSLNSQTDIYISSKSSSNTSSDSSCSSSSRSNGDGDNEILVWENAGNKDLGCRSSLTSRKKPVSIKTKKISHAPRSLTHTYLRPIYSLLNTSLHTTF